MISDTPVCIIPEVSLPTSRCPHPERWHCIDAMASETEVFDMLTTLVWMLKPETIVETGCYKGYGTVALLNGVLKNGFGHIYTCDVDHTMILETTERLDEALDKVAVIQVPGEELISGLTIPIDFAFLDSGGHASVRAEELRRVVPKLSPWGVVAVHDTGETHPDIREAIEGVVAELGLASVFFDTPRGFSLIRKRT